MRWFIKGKTHKSNGIKKRLIKIQAIAGISGLVTAFFSSTLKLFSFTCLLPSAYISSPVKKIACIMLCAVCWLPVSAQTVKGKSNKVYVKVTKEPVGEKAALSYSQVIFKDPNKSQAIDPAEETTVDFTIKNEGKAPSQNLLIKAYSSNEIKGLIFSGEIKIDGIRPGKSQDISIPISSSRALESGTANIIIEIREEYEYDPDQIEINILTEEVR